MSIRSHRSGGVALIDLREFARLLGYPAGKPLEAEVLARAEGAIEWYRANGEPMAWVRVEGKEALAAFTAGFEVEDEVARLWKSDRVDEAFFLDRLAAGVVERMASTMGAHRSPGHTGFPIEDQPALFSRIAPPSSSIRILPSGMLNPKNSLLAVYRLDENVPDAEPGSPCSRCGLRGCSFRRSAA